MRNRGTVVVLAVIFMAIFVVLGISLYSLGSTSIQVARNNREAQVAMAAAESGMAFLQRLIGDIKIIETNATGQGAMQRIAARLATLNGTATLGGQSISVSPDSASPTSITIPSFTPHRGSKQRVTARISLAAADLAASRPPITLSVTGSSQTGSNSHSYDRTISVRLVARDRTLQIFSYGVFSNGSICFEDKKTGITGNPPSSGSVGSAYTGGGVAIQNDGGTISGDVFVTGDPLALFDINGGSVGGVDGATEDVWDNVHEAPTPEIPPFNPNRYYQSDLAVVDAAGDLSRLPALADMCIQPPFPGGRLKIRFSGGDVLQGLIYVKPGVTLEFSGGATVQGVIVVEDPGTGEMPSASLEFTGTPLFTDPVWPAGSVVSPAVQAELSGYSVLGPTAHIAISGNTSSNDPNAGFAGTVVCGTFSQGGDAAVKIRDGTLIALSPTGPASSNGYSVYFGGEGVIIERSPGYTAPFTGTAHYYSWVVDRMTYQESQ